MSEEMDERIWIANSKAGDLDSFNLIVKKYDSYIKYIISLYVDKQLVEDIAQEIWIQIYKKLWQLEDNHKFLSWVRKLIYYQCVNYRKKYSRQRSYERNVGTEAWINIIDTVTSDHFSIQEILEFKEIRKEIHRTLDQLNGDYGLIIHLRYIQELTYHEIKEITELPLSTIKWRIHQGKKLLKVQLLHHFNKKGKKPYDK